VIGPNGTRRVRANTASSLYHSWQNSLEKRFSKGFSLGAHYTWSAFIDSATEIFNPAVNGDVAVSQDSFNRRADRGRSTYDRTHRFHCDLVVRGPVHEGAGGRCGQDPWAGGKPAASSRSNPERRSHLWRESTRAGD
jgi:hypothetical protein